MKRILCVCVIFLLLCNLISCKADYEKDFPTDASALYPTVEGERVPFKILFCNDLGKDFIIRTEKELNNVLQRTPFRDNLSEEQKELLLKIDYDRYQVLGVTICAHRSSVAKGLSQVRELVEQNGEIMAVYAADQQPTNEQEDIYINVPDSFDFETITTVMLIRKEDAAFPVFDDYQNIEIQKWKCYDDSSRVEAVESFH